MGEKKILFHNFKKNIGKHIVILVISVITLVAAIISISFENITLDIRSKQLAEMSLNAEILVTPLDTNDVEAEISILEKIRNVIKVVPKTIIDVESNIGKEVYTLYGVDYFVQNELSEIPIIEGEISSTENLGIMISSALAEERSLSIGDKVVLCVEQSNLVDMEIIAICDEKCGLFDNYSTCLLANRALVERMTGIGINRLDISIENLEEIDETVNAISDALEDYDVEISQKYDSSFYDSFIFTVVLALRIFVIFSLIIAIYLIFSLYRTLIVEQSSEMSIMRTLGLTIKGYIIFVIKQVLTTNVIASILSYFLSKVIIQIMLKIFVGYSGEVNIFFNPVLLLMIYISFFAISIGSVVSAVYKQVSIPIIQIIRYGVSLEEKKCYKTVVGIILFIFSFLLYFVFDSTLSILICSLVLAIAAMVLLSDIAVSSIVFVSNYIRIGKLTAGLKQIRTFKKNYTLVFNLASFVIVLLVTGISISTDLTSSISKIYADETIYTEVYSVITDEQIKKVSDSVSANDILRIKRAFINIDDDRYMIEAVPIDDYKNRQYETVYREKVSHERLFERLNDKNTIIVSSTIAKNFGFDKGDIIKNGNQDLIIDGIVATYENMGKMIYTSYETFENLEKKSDFDVILFQCEDSEESICAIKESFNEFSIPYSIQSIKEMLRSNNERNQMVIKIITMLSEFIGIVAVICLYNTINVCLYNKIGNYIIFRAIGVDKSMLILTEVIESAVISIVNLIYGLIFGYYINLIVGNIVSLYYGEGCAGLCDFKYIALIAFVIEAAYIGCKIILMKKRLFKVDIVQGIKERAV